MYMYIVYVCNKLKIIHVNMQLRRGHHFLFQYTTQIVLYESLYFRIKYQFVKLQIHWHCIYNNWVFEWKHFSSL